VLSPSDEGELPVLVQGPMEEGLTWADRGQKRKTSQKEKFPLSTDDSRSVGEQRGLEIWETFIIEGLPHER